MMNSKLHLDIKQWLNSLDLSQYCHCFESNGGGVENLLHLDEADIKSLGVKNGAHRAQIVSSLLMLRGKYDRMASEFQRNKKRISLESLGHSVGTLTRQKPLLTSRFISDANDFSKYPKPLEAVCKPNANVYELRKALEWELSLDSRDLRSHAWYHGSVPRVRAEELVGQEGDFLIRDCTSQPGDYVLTCRCQGQALHFLINKIVLQPDTVYERVQYRLEDESYETVPDLVTCYVGSGKMVSSASGVKITRPINRTLPLSFYVVRYSQTENEFGSRNPTPSHSPNQRHSTTENPPPPLPEKTFRPVTPVKNDYANSKPGDFSSPPPKPNRNPHGTDSENDSDVCNGNESSTTTTTYETGVKVVVNAACANGKDRRKITLPVLEPPSAFDLSAANQLLLSEAENRPLDQTTLRRVHGLLLDYGSRVLAVHLTALDFELLRMRERDDLGLDVKSGLELITLPHGKQLRQDIIERTLCLKLFVSVTILTCSNEVDRAQLIRKWVDLAIDIKTCLGNLYSFTAIMMGLGHPQIQRLKSTWASLRSLDTDTAFTYETKLRPTLKSMNECSNPEAPNTTIPHLLPLVMALEKGTDDDPPWSFPWEQSNCDYGTELLFQHLTAGRDYVQQAHVYKRNCEIVVEQVTKYEPLVLALFGTEFHMKFLWGSKGAHVNSAERHAKYEQVLAAMSQRCESST